VRRELLQEQLEALALKREKEAGRLVDADQVRKATFEKARVARNALLGLVDVISSRWPRKRIRRRCTRC
jgi:phage terminase Nu1 subunit (DNA packaging protein)